VRVVHISVPHLHSRDFEVLGDSARSGGMEMDIVAFFAMVETSFSVDIPHIFGHIHGFNIFGEGEIREFIDSRGIHAAVSMPSRERCNAYVQ